MDGFPLDKSKNGSLGSSTLLTMYPMCLSLTLEGEGKLFVIHALTLSLPLLSSHPNHLTPFILYFSLMISHLCFFTHIFYPQIGKKTSKLCAGNNNCYLPCSDHGINGVMGILNGHMIYLSNNYHNKKLVKTSTLMMQRF